MSTHENIYDHLHDFLGMDQMDISILEENINSDLQMEYFECSRTISKFKSEEEILRDKDNLFDLEMSLDKKKRKLIELASISSIEAYRTIEKYSKQPNIKLYHWACLALQQSRLHLESDLLNESKVLITSALGGKGLKLRYFIVLFTPYGKSLNPIQQLIITKEVNYALSQYNAELEDSVFEGEFASLLCLIPLNIPLQQLFKSIICECNQLGNFLYNNFIVTNVKALSNKEIREMLILNNIY